MNEKEILASVQKSGQRWLDAFAPNGNADMARIQEILSQRTHNGKLVDAYVVKAPEDVLPLKAVIQAKHPGFEFPRDLALYAWDYYFMSFYESACSVLPNKDFDGAEFIYQSLFPAFEAGLGVLINLGPVVIGVCLPEAHLDERARLHSSIGPAFVWGKTKTYWWHGEQIPAEWIENPDSVDPSLALTHPNIEKRRALCEILEWETILPRLDPTLLDEDIDPQIGSLYVADLPDHGEQKFLRVLEESTGRRFALLAPDEATTALQAQSLICQMPEELFRLGYVRT